MKKNSLRFTIMLSIILLTSCASSKQNNYKFIEIKECNIPIPQIFKLIEKENQYEYAYFHSRPLSSSSFISIHKKKKDEYNRTLSDINEFDDMKLVSETRKGDFIIIQFSLAYDNDIHYRLIGKESMIQLLHTSKKEVDYLIDYCEKTRRMRGNSKKSLNET